MRGHFGKESPPEALRQLRHSDIYVNGEKRDDVLEFDTEEGWALCLVTLTYMGKDGREYRRFKVDRATNQPLTQLIQGTVEIRLRKEGAE